MWKDILKSPYKIQTEEYINTYRKLFQGTQREEDTGYWTPSLDEALIYAFFGSEIYSIKDEGKPMIKQALKTNKEKWLEGDKEYTVNRNIRNKKELGMSRGISHDRDIEYKYLPDSVVKKKATELMNLIDDATEYDYPKITGYFRSAAGMELSLDEDVMETKEHMKNMLEKYFG
jgi:hypothetical protein